MAARPRPLRRDDVRAATADARIAEPPKVRPAGSRSVTSPSGLPLLCVGDAAVSFDPVSGQGIFKALRSGIFASYAIADLLRRNDESGVTRYRAFVSDEFSAYRQTLHDYYALEQRWADRPFWRRRHAGLAVRRPGPTADLASPRGAHPSL